MMDEIGTDGAFMDGFFLGYRGRWTYDRWDNHSAEIDLATKTIKRKMASVLLLSQPSMVEFSRKIRDKGGVVIANNSVITRTITGEKYLYHDQEIHSGPYLHLAPTASALSNSPALKTERDLYLDVLDKLQWGMLYLYFWQGQITRPTLPTKQFPLTFQTIHAGTIVGKERIVTMNSGVYGWPGDRDLHVVWFCDDRGEFVPNRFMTTADKGGVRTELRFSKNESAVIERIPVTLAIGGAVNLLVRQYDAEGIDMLLSGVGRAMIRIRTGQFPITPGATYRVTSRSAKTIVASDEAVVDILVQLDGQLSLSVVAAD